jgi:SAM-dependent methyltransferase
VTDKSTQYARKAEGWSDREYADPGPYLEHRADLVASLGVPLRAGDTVLDLACGDGALGELLLERGYHYRGVDVEPAMAAAARRRLGDRALVEVGDLNTFEPSEVVAATTLFRALYYATDRRVFFRRARAFTSGKLLFDLNPRQFSPEAVVADLREAGFEQVVLRPFFIPQTVKLPRLLVGALRQLEGSGPLARLLLRRRFSYLVAAS